MTRFWTAGLISLPLVALLSGAAPAATDFEDIPYLQARINQVLEREPTGAEVGWRNEATGNSGVIRVLKTYFPSPDAPCRDYERTTRLPGGGESRDYSFASPPHVTERFTFYVKVLDSGAMSDYVRERARPIHSGTPACLRNATARWVGTRPG